MRVVGFAAVAGGLFIAAAGVAAAARGAWPMALLGFAACGFLTFVGMLVLVPPPQDRDLL